MQLIQVSVQSKWVCIVTQVSTFPTQAQAQALRVPSAYQPSQFLMLGSFSTHVQGLTLAVSQIY